MKLGMGYIIVNKFIFSKMGPLEILFHFLVGIKWAKEWFGSISDKD